MTTCPVCSRTGDGCARIGRVVTCVSGHTGAPPTGFTFKGRARTGVYKYHADDDATAEPGGDQSRRNSIPASKEKGLAGMESKPPKRRPRPTPGDGKPSPTNGANSIPAGPRSISAGYESDWTPIPLSQIPASAAVDWVWTGFAARGMVTLLVGLFKLGKTTLLAWLLREMAVGGDLAGEVKPGRVLVVSEESGKLWALRRDEMQLGDHVELLARPFKGRCNWHEWERLIDRVAALTRERGYALVVFDTLASLWPVVDENSAADVLRAVLPLHRIVEAGAALLLNHHPRKSDGAEGTASRGSGALPGFVDVIIELRPFAAGDRHNRRRTLACFSRLDETPAEVVIELTDTGYVAIGDKADAGRADRRRLLQSLLPAHPPGATVEEIRDNWPDGGQKPGVRTLRDDLKAMDVRTTGEGVKGDRFRYYLAPNPSCADNGGATPGLSNDESAPAPDYSNYPEAAGDVTTENSP